MEKPLTRRQYDALNDADRHGSAFHNIGIRGRTGGAYSRMIVMLRTAGLLAADHSLTDAGRARLIVERGRRRAPPSP